MLKTKFFYLLLLSSCCLTSWATGPKRNGLMTRQQYAASGLKRVNDLLRNTIQNSNELDNNWFVNLTVDFNTLLEQDPNSTDLQRVCYTGPTPFPPAVRRLYAEVWGFDPDYGIDEIYPGRGYTFNEFKSLALYKYLQDVEWSNEILDFLSLYNYGCSGEQVLERISQYGGRDFFKNYQAWQAKNALKERSMRDWLRKADHIMNFAKNTLLTEKGLVTMCAIALFFMVAQQVFIPFLKLLFMRKPQTTKYSSLRFGLARLLFFIRPTTPPAEASFFNPSLQRNLSKVVAQNKRIRSFNNKQRQRNYYGHRKSYRNLLLFGLPGTGKTLWAQNLAHKTGMAFHITSGAMLAQLPMEDALKELYKTFSAARATGNCIIVIDEAETIFGNRDKAMSEKSIFMVQALLTLLERKSDPTVQVILITNRPWALDSAVRSRMGIRIHFDEPNFALRKRIFAYYLEKKTLLPKKLAIELASSLDKKLTEGLVGRDIQDICVALTEYKPKEVNYEKLVTAINDFKSQDRAEKTYEASLQTSTKLNKSLW